MTTTEKTQALIDQLKEGISKVRSSEDWKAHLALSSHFWAYSFGNQLLIASQCPAATMVTGLRSWNKLGRSVNGGSKSIRILAPRIINKEVKKNGVTEKQQFLAGFRAVPVFDISQTNGKDLPVLAHKLVGAAPAGVYEKVADYLASNGFPVSREEVPGEANGYAMAGKIVVDSGLSDAQALKTLLHEAGHAMLGHCGNNDKGTDLKELEAETTSYICCKALGLDPDPYSFGYLASWSYGDDTGKLLEKAGQVAAVIAKKILKALEGKAPALKAVA